MSTGHFKQPKRSTPELPPLLHILPQLIFPQSSPAQEMATPSLQFLKPTVLESFWAPLFFAYPQSESTDNCWLCLQNIPRVGLFLTICPTAALVRATILSCLTASTLATLSSTHNMAARRMVLKMSGHVTSHFTRWKSKSLQWPTRPKIRAPIFSDFIPTTLSHTHSPPAMLVRLLFLQNRHHLVTSGPLHLVIPLPRIGFFQTSTFLYFFTLFRSLLSCHLLREVLLDYCL